MNRRRIVIGVSAVSGIAALSAGAALSLTGSGGAKGVDLKVSPIAAVRAAAGATEKAQTAQVDTVVTMTTPAVPAKGATPATAAKTTTMQGSGLFDFGRRIGKIDLTVAGGGLQEVLTPASLYLRTAPPAAQAAGGPTTTSGKGWERVDIGRLSDGNLVSGGSTDPVMALAMLGGASPDVKYVGQDVVRDTPVAHYQGTLDLADAANASVTARDSASASAADAADKKALTNASRAFLTTKVPFDVYLDSDGRLRRFVARFSFAVPGPGKVAAEVTSSTELFAFGIPVGVSTPSAPSPTTPATPGKTPATSGKTPATAGKTPGAPDRDTPSPSRSAHK